MGILRFAVLSVWLLLPASPSAAAVYEWVDDSGVIHFTDNADKIPRKYQKKARMKGSDDGSVTVTPATVPSDWQHERQATDVGMEPVRNDEGMWRSRFGTLREEKKQIEKGLPAKREKLATLRRKRVIYQRGSDRTAYNELNADIERDEARIKELDQKLQELNAEASRAGVPMEWRQ
ncbi:DUF4124 domain-containing protein [Geotalea sp. SG265]|uniref:DUF4124 domain-containing protein n=1 Tax=Geotalea sp. SG265 TaxID=2922867 RepID=UPI001FB03E39|nr:DUF4124 domain-containing protein [Geotalea sp. SG265]